MYEITYGAAPPPTTTDTTAGLESTRGHTKRRRLALCALSLSGVTRLVPDGFVGRVLVDAVYFVFYSKFSPRSCYHTKRDNTHPRRLLDTPSSTVHPLRHAPPLYTFCQTPTTAG